MPCATEPLRCCAAGVTADNTLVHEVPGALSPLGAQWLMEADQPATR